MADAYTDYAQGAPAADGQRVRAVSDSGYGSSPGNAMEMMNFLNDESSAMGSTAPPTMRVINGKKNINLGGDTVGLWCRKTMPVPGAQPNPRNRVPYTTQDAHFTLAAVRIPAWGGSGVVFQASQRGELYVSELTFNNSRPQAKIDDNAGSGVVLTSPTALPPDTPAVISYTCVPGAQRLRVNSSLVASGSASFAARPFEQLLIGWGFTQYFPRDVFSGGIYSVITGKGAPTTQELAVLERYLGATAGIVI
jgi:hypothetical protein